MNGEKIKLFMVDDSPVARDLLTYVLETDPALQIIGYAQNGEEALQWLKYQTPDVITMDITMPLMDGFAATRRIMQIKPTPIVIVSSYYDYQDSEKSFQAMQAGALAIMQKPQGIHDRYLIKELLETIHLIHGCKLVTRRLQPLEQTLAQDNPPLTEIHGEPILAIGIGASLGGPVAVEKILSALPSTLPVPIFLVQHISLGFTKGLADWLQKSCKLKIKIATDGEVAQAGCVYLPPDGYFMHVKKDNLIKLVPQGIDDHRPGIGQLFQSMAHVYGPRAIGIILTGMGKDGAAELLMMREKGAFTIAQDEESCVLFGMPKEAIKLGAAKQILPLEKISETILRFLGQSSLQN